MPPHRTVYMKLIWKKVDVDEDLAYRIFHERARILYEILTFAGGFNPALTQEGFWTKAGEIVRHYSEQLLSHQSDNAFSDLESIYLQQLPAALVAALNSYLPSSHDDVLALFQRYARRFYETLRTAHAFTQPLPEDVFLARSTPALSDITARLFRLEAIAKQETPLAGLDTALLGLPEHLLLQNKSHIAFFNFDYESGYQSFFEQLSGALERISLTHTWTYDEEKQAIHVTIEGMHVALLHVSSVDGELDTPLYRLLDDIKHHLAVLGWAWFELATGDQTQSNLLVPADQVSQLRQYLPHNYDRRAQLFYGFLYDAEQFASPERS